MKPTHLLKLPQSALVPVQCCDGKPINSKRKMKHWAWTWNYRLVTCPACAKTEEFQQKAKE